MKEVHSDAGAARTVRAVFHAADESGARTGGRRLDRIQIRSVAVLS